MSLPKHITLTLPYQVLVAACLGIVAGLILGNKAALLEPIGRIYTMLMEVAVFPYIISTLLISLGSLTPALSWRLFKSGWSIYLALIGCSLLILIILGQAIPVNISFTPSATGSGQAPHLLPLLIPENFFFDLASNDVPAVIVFCIIFGLVLQHIQQKKGLFSILKTISKASLLFWQWLIYLVPIATFALVAYLIGTINLAKLYDVSEFLILFIFGAILLSFWLIPISISASTGLSYRKILFHLRDALIISAITTLSVVALPYIEKITEKFLADHHEGTNDEETADLIKTILLIGYPLAQLGNYFIYLFMLFASLYFDHALSSGNYLLLPIVTFLSSIGSPSSAINAVQFLSHWLGLPVDTVNLYVGLSPLIRYIQVILSVMAFSFLAILVGYQFFGLLKINAKKIIPHFLVALVLLVAFVLTVKHIFPNPSEKSYARLNSFSLDTSLTEGVKASIAPSFDESMVEPAKQTEDALFRIQRTGVLRVGFNSDMRPFSFFNNQKQLVGYDIAYAYALAKALNSELQFVPFTWPYLIKDLQANKFDIAMSAIYATTERLSQCAFSDPYFHSPLAFIVPKANQGQFQTAEQIKNIVNFHVGVFNDPVLVPLIQNNFPNAQIVLLSDTSGQAPAKAFAQKKIDAVVWSEAQTKVWVLKHPQFISIVPSGIASPFLMAYMLDRNSPQLLNFLNYWLSLKENEGFQQKMINKWILIRP